MNTADLQKARSISKQVAAFGAPKKTVYKPKYAPKEPDFLRRLRPLPKMVEKPVKGLSTYRVGRPPLKGIDYFTDSDKREMITAILSELRIPASAIPEVTDEFVKAIVQKMHSLPENDKLEVSKGIRNARSFIYGGTKYNMHEMMHGGSSSPATGTAVYGEAVTGSGTSWTLTHTPESGTLRLYANGQRLTVTTDYTLNGTAITTVLSWAVGTVLADYSYA